MLCLKLMELIFQNIRYSVTTTENLYFTRVLIAREVGEELHAVEVTSCSGVYI